MKKMFIVLSAVLLSGALSADAYIDSQFMITEKFLHNTGYSTELARMSQITAGDPYRDLPNKNESGNILKRVYHYISPSEYTDLDFYDHDINVNNQTWYDF